MPSEFKPMLFEGAISEAEAQALVGNDAFWMQQKADGHRVLVFVANALVYGRSRTGLPYTISREAQASLLKIGRVMVLDAEAVNGRLVVFDLLALDGNNWRDRAYSERLFQLEELIPRPLPSVQVIQTCRDQWSKEAAYPMLRDGGAEGVVFKR